MNIYFQAPMSQWDTIMLMIMFGLELCSMLMEDFGSPDSSIFVPTS